MNRRVPLNKAPLSSQEPSPGLSVAEMHAIQRKQVVTEDNISWTVGKYMTSSTIDMDQVSEGEEECLSDESDAEFPESFQVLETVSRLSNHLAAVQKAPVSVPESFDSVPSLPLSKSASRKPSVSIVVSSGEHVFASSAVCDNQGPAPEKDVKKKSEAATKKREQAFKDVQELLAAVSRHREARKDAMPLRKKRISRTAPARILEPVRSQVSLSEQSVPSCVENLKSTSWPVMIFDWDDTLFPTWYITEVVYPSLPPEGKYAPLPEDSMFRQPLRSHANRVRETLIAASSVAQVAIVTLASKAWVTDSSNWYLPDLDIEALFAELNIKVFYAREYVSPSMARAANDEEGVNTFVVAKRNAMSKCIRSLRKKRQWEHANVISIGDSIVEREACKELMWYNGTDGNLCKTVKMIDEPPLHVLSMELQVLASWFRSLVNYADDADIDFGDDPTSSEIVLRMLSSGCNKA